MWRKQLPEDALLDTGPDLDRLIAEDRVSRPRRSTLPEPLEMKGDPHVLSRALDEVRGDR